MKEGRYYIEYYHSNTNTAWNKNTNNRNSLKKMIKDLSYNQAMWIYDNKTNEVIFNKLETEYEARINTI